MRKSTFWADFLNTSVDGWTDGELWNGWATPQFEFNEAMIIMNLLNEMPGAAKGMYDSEGDQFCFEFEEHEEPECYKVFSTTLNGELVKLYPIGARSWIWEEVNAVSQ